MDRLGFLLRARAEFGDLVRFNGRTTIVNDVELARLVLQGPDSKFQITENFVQRKLTSREIEAILSGRALLNPGLRRSVVAGVQPLVASLAVDLLAATAARAVDPVPVLEQVTSRAIAAYYFGDEGSDLPAACAALLDALSEVIGNPFALPATWRTSVRRRIDYWHQHLSTRVSFLLSRRVAHPSRYDDGAASVIRAADGSKAGVPHERLANLVIGAMLAASPAVITSSSAPRCWVETHSCSPTRTTSTHHAGGSLRRHPRHSRSAQDLTAAQAVTWPRRCLPRSPSS